MNFSAVIERIKAFRDARDWAQFHNAKEMATAIAIEASELQEIFLWKSPSELKETVIRKREQIEDEIADIAIFLVELIDDLQINLEQAILKKLEKNELKYPVEKARGSNVKYTDLA